MIVHRASGGRHGIPGGGQVARFYGFQRHGLVISEVPIPPFGGEAEFLADFDLFPVFTAEVEVLGLTFTAEVSVTPALTAIAQVYRSNLRAEVTTYPALTADVARVTH